MAIRTAHVNLNIGHTHDVTIPRVFVSYCAGEAPGVGVVLSKNQLRWSKGRKLQKFREQIPEYKLEAIGDTRWRSRSNAVKKVFGRIQVDEWTSSEEQSSNAAKPKPKFIWSWLCSKFHTSLFQRQSETWNSCFTYQVSGFRNNICWHGILESVKNHHATIELSPNKESRLPPSVEEYDGVFS
ncbi:hypothetical protein J6590_079086 [Homalodisca vitripennis]|nr:hypothetical protein J6590_079086 [Homalodisca vitripennis]